MSEQMLMKYGLAEAAVNRIAQSLAAVSRKHKIEFDQKSFQAACMQGLNELELKQRVDHIIVCLQAALPNDFRRSAKLLKAIPEVWDYGSEDDPYRGFAAWPLIDFVAVAGIHHPKQSLACLEMLTPVFSAEFAIRAFIETHPAITFEALNRWLRHKSEHVRRLVSEGTRPRLPWGRQLKGFIQNPEPILPLLEALRFDKSLYVRRSVANNLNDIAKDHPERVLSLCSQWLEDAKTVSEEDSAAIAWVVRHATRSLVKQGHPKSFALLGYTAKPRVKVADLVVNAPKVNMGKSLAFSFDLVAQTANQKVVVDYAVHYRKANGTLSMKVFKLKNITLGKTETVSLSGKVDFKPITTRKYYPGQHLIAVHINGVEKARCDFELVKLK